MNDVSRKRRKIEKRLRKLRLSTYTIISFAIFQLTGIFAMAGLKGLYVTTEQMSNAFYPKTYVDVEIEEPNGSDYVVSTENGAVTNSKGNKEASVVNGAGNKKDVVLRARIVANIYNEAGQIIGQTQDYELTGNFTKTASEKDKWYVATGTLTDGKVVSTSTGNQDTYYYYTSVLGAGDKSKNLIDSVKLTNVSNIPDDGYVDFHIIIDAVEVDTSATTKAAQLAKAIRAWDSNSINGLWGYTTSS